MPTHTRPLFALLLGLLASCLCAPSVTRAEDITASQHARIAAVDAELAKVQRHSRLYLYGWLSADVLLGAGQLAIALTTDEPAVRGSAYLGTGLAVAGVAILSLQPWPALHGLAKYRAQPASTPDQERAKIAYGEALIARQSERDRIARRWDKHVFAAVVSTAAGLGIGLGYRDLQQGLLRGFSLMAVMELQILTRPRPRASAAGQRVALGPWGDRHAQGLALLARY